MNTPSAIALAISVFKSRIAISGNDIISTAAAGAGISVGEKLFEAALPDAADNPADVGKKVFHGSRFIGVIHLFRKTGGL